MMRRVEASSTLSEHSFYENHFPPCVLDIALAQAFFLTYLPNYTKNSSAQNVWGVECLETAKNTVVCNIVVIYLPTIRKRICWIRYLLQTCFC